MMPELHAQLDAQPDVETQQISSDKTESSTAQPWRSVVFDLLRWEHAGWMLYVMAAGACLGLFWWQQHHPSLLKQFFLTNQLGPEERRLLLWNMLAGAMALPFIFSLSVLLAYHRGWNARALLRYAPAWSLPICCLPLISFLTIDQIESQQRFLTLSIIAAAGVLVYCASRHARPVNDVAPLIIDDQRKSWGAGLMIVVLLSLGYGVYFSYLTLARHAVFDTHTLDLGIQDQIAFNVARHGRLFTTLAFPKYAEPCDFLQMHMSPVFYLIAPIYALRPNATTLLVMQSAVLGLAAIPLFLLARRHCTALLPAVVICFSYLAHPAIHGVNRFDFHELAFVPLFLLWAFYFMETRRTVLFVAFLLLAMSAKEEMLMTGTAVGLYVAWAQRRWRLGMSIAVITAVLFVLVVCYVQPQFGWKHNTARFSGMIAPGMSGFSGVLVSIITNPIFTFQYVFSNPDKLAYLAYLLVPLAFLPVLGGRAWIIAVPALCTALLSSFSGQYILGQQYPAAVVPTIYYLAVRGTGRVRQHRLGSLATAMAVAAVLLNYSYGLIIPSKDQNIWLRPAGHDQVLHRMIAKIPREASVSAQQNRMPHLSSRERAYRFPPATPPEYILFDSHQTTNFLGDWDLPRRQVLDQLMPYLTGGDYGVLDYEDGCLLLKRGADTRANRNIRLEEVSLTDYLRAHAAGWLILSACDEASNGLDAELHQYAQSAGSRIADLKYHGSYVAVWHSGRVVSEVICNDGPAVIKARAGSTLGDLKVVRNMHIQSAGALYGRHSRIRIDGAEHSPGLRGMNIVALDGSMNYVGAVNFDTHKTCREMFLEMKPEQASTATAVAPGDE